MDKREMRQMLQANLQASGLSRFEARRRIYGSTWKLSTAPGRGVQLAITKEEKLRREAMNGAIDREAEAGSTQVAEGNPLEEWDRQLSDAGQGPRASSVAAASQRPGLKAGGDSGESQPEAGQDVQHQDQEG